ncbi:hypothetical protein GCM10009839_00450 [Catenulispora yoronensis]|uniref:Polyketide cyclase / dehydrase and lipid transport n=1 Tax=Catenulispora yoronensis TaxID=450799 RepID=A0ABP5F1P7_9ACTN
MIEIEHRATFPQTAEQVFAAVVDFPTLPRWQADVLAAELTSADLALGAVVHQVRKVMGKRTETDFTATEYVAGELLTLETAADVKPAVRQRYRVTADGTGSVVEFQLRLDGVPKMAEHLAKAQLGKNVPKMFNNLGALLAGVSVG